MESTNIHTFFTKRRIYLAIFFGLSVSFWLIYKALQQTEFKEVEVGTGSFSWVDSNGNHKVDSYLSAEFKSSPKGNYTQQSALEVLGEIKWNAHVFFWLFMALLAMVGRDLAYMWRIRILTKRELEWKPTANVILLWEFASALSPGVLSGAAVAMFILNREGIQLGKSTAIVILTAFFDNLFYVLLIPIVFLTVSGTSLIPSSDYATTATSLFWIGYSIFACLCGLLFMSIFFFPRLIGTILTIVTSFSFLKRFQKGAQKTGTEIATTANSFQQESWLFWIKTFGATICSWTSRYLVINCILHAFLSLSAFQHILILGKQLILWMFLRISPTPGGSGVAEWAFATLLSDLGTSALLLAAMAVLWRLISYFPYLIIGSILLPNWLKKR